MFYLAGSVRPPLLLCWSGGGTGLKGTIVGYKVEGRASCGGAMTMENKPALLLALLHKYNPHNLSLVFRVNIQFYNILYFKSKKNFITIKNILDCIQVLGFTLDEGSFLNK